MNIPTPSIPAFPTQAFNLNNVIIAKINPYSHSGFLQESRALITDADELKYSSSLGTLVYSPFKIEAGTYTGYDNVQYSIPEMVFDTTIISTTQAKNIVKTAIAGRNGKVKEYVGLDDYDITINIVIASNQNDVYPAEAVATLKQILTAPVALGVSGPFLEQLDIYSIVIDGFDMVQVEGGYSQQGFTIRASSDTNIQIIEVLV